MGKNKQSRGSSRKSKSTAYEHVHTHNPKAHNSDERRLEALKNVQVDFGLTGGSHEESAIYVVMTHLTFDSIESFEKIFPIHAEELLSDIPRFTNSRPQLQISEVTI